MKKKIVLLVIVLLIAICNISKASDRSESIELLWEARVPNLISGLKNPLPTVTNYLLYFEEWGDEHNIKVYEIRDGQIIGTIKTPKSYNEIDLTGNDRYFLYATDTFHEIRLYSGLALKWSYKFEEAYLIDAKIDDKYIYAYTSGGIYIFDLSGTIIKTLDIKGSIHVSSKYIYVLGGKELYKVEKDTWKIIYEKKYHQPIYGVKHNENYIISSYLPIINKKDGKFLKEDVPLVEEDLYREIYAINEEYIVLIDLHYRYPISRIICLDNDLNIVLDKIINEDVRTYLPVINRDYFYFVTETALKVMDLRTGEIVWEDRNISDREIDIVPWMYVYQDEYLFLCNENGDGADLRVYRINF